MTFEYEEKPSRSRFVDIIWRTHDTSDGTYLAAADACWDMIFIRSAHGNRVLLSGPSSKITPVPYRAGNRNVGIRFHRGTFLTHVPTSAMVDTTEALPMPADESFLLAGLDWSMPTYESADDFVDELERLDLLSDDPLVMAALRGEEAPTSQRSVQRHVSSATGLTANRIRQIVRARTAAERLQQGESILDVAHDMGYADQAHLTRDLKRLTGYHPRPDEAARRAVLAVSGLSFPFNTSEPDSALMDPCPVHRRRIVPWRSARSPSTSPRPTCATSRPAWRTRAGRRMSSPTGVAARRCHMPEDSPIAGRTTSTGRPSRTA